MRKSGFMKKSPIWIRFFSVSLLLMFIIILIMTMFCIIQMRNKENKIIESNISNSIYYAEQNISNSLLRYIHQVGSQTAAEEFYRIKNEDTINYHRNIRKALADICNESSEVFAVFYRDCEGNCYSAGEVFWSINSQLKMISDCKNEKNYTKGGGLWRYARAGRGYNSLIWCKDIVYVDKNYNQIDMGTIILYLDIERLSEDFFGDSMQTYTAICDADGIIAMAQDTTIIGRSFDDIFSVTAQEVAEKDGISYLFSKKASAIEGWEILSYIETDMTGRNIAKTMTSTIVFAFFSLLVVFVVSYVLSQRIGKPIEELLKYIKINRYGDITELKDGEDYDDIAKIRHTFEEMSADLRKNIESNYEMKLKLKEITIKVYESQMNPHFIFNTLQLIQMMNVLNEKDNATMVTNGLGELLRFNLDSRNEVKLSEEIENVINYLKIMELRFKGNFNYKIIIPPEIMDCYTVKFMLQPLIENSVSHGFMHKKKSCEIVIMGQKIGDEIAIIVKDNGQGIEPDKLETIKESLKKNEDTSNGIGIKNVHERIQLIYGEQYGIDIYSEYTKNTNVLIHIPVSKIPKEKEN